MPRQLLLAIGLIGLIILRGRRPALPDGARHYLWSYAYFLALSVVIIVGLELAVSALGYRHLVESGVLALSALGVFLIGVTLTLPPWYLAVVPAARRGRWVGNRGVAVAIAAVLIAATPMYLHESEAALSRCAELYANRGVEAQSIDTVRPSGSLAPAPGRGPNDRRAYTCGELVAEAAARQAR